MITIWIDGIPKYIQMLSSSSNEPISQPRVLAGDEALAATFEVFDTMVPKHLRERTVAHKIRLTNLACEQVRSAAGTRS